MLFLLNYVSINKKNLCTLCISFEKTICKSVIGEWYERPTTVPRVPCSIPIIRKNFLISKFIISLVYGSVQQKRATERA